MALMMGEDQYRAWGNLADAVQTGDMSRKWKGQ